jgi:hypothetical protein
LGTIYLRVESSFELDQQSMQGCAKNCVSWPATTPAHGPKSLCQSLCQRPPRRPVLPVMPVHNCFTVNNLGFWHFHGMEQLKPQIIDGTALNNRHNRQKRPTGHYLRAKCGQNYNQVAEGLIRVESAQTPQPVPRNYAASCCIIACVRASRARM